MYIEMQTKNTKSFESIFLKQSNPAFKITRNLQFIWQFTMLSFLNWFQMTPAWSVHLRLGNVFWRIRLRETILTGHWIQWVQLYRTIDKTHVWRFRFMSSSKNLFMNFYLDFDKIENVGWKTSVDNLHEFYRIWCNIFRYNAHLVICQISNCKMKTIVSYSLLSIYVSDIMLKSSTLPLMTLFAGF